MPPPSEPIPQRLRRSSTHVAVVIAVAATFTGAGGSDDTDRRIVDPGRVDCSGTEHH